MAKQLQKCKKTGKSENGEDSASCKPVSAKWFPHLPLPNIRHERFCQSYVNDPTASGNASQSYIIAYGVDVKYPQSNAAKILQKCEIKERILHLRNKAQINMQKKFSLTREKWLEKWELMIKDDKRDKIQISALEAIGKACGWNIEKGDSEAKSGGISISISVNTSGRKLDTAPAPGAVLDVAAVAIPEHSEAGEVFPFPAPSGNPQTAEVVTSKQDTPKQENGSFVP